MAPRVVKWSQRIINGDWVIRRKIWGVPYAYAYGVCHMVQMKSERERLVTSPSSAAFRQRCGSATCLSGSVGVFGGYLGGIWGVFGGYLGGSWGVFGGYLRGIWGVFGGWLD